MKFPALFLLLALLVTSRPAAAAGDWPAQFDVANKSYAEGKFADAAGVYEKMIRQARAEHAVSPALYFNDGNAEFKLGHLGRAIAAYRHAALLAPRDGETLGNLEFVRNQVPGASVRPGRWQGFIGSLTLNEGACVTAVLFWLTFALLTMRQLRPALALRLHGVTLAVVGLTVLSLGVLAVQATEHFHAQTAVVIQANAIARSGPFDDAQNVFPVHDGTELSILDWHDDWLQVTDGSGRIGWLPRHDLELLPGA